MAQIEADDEDQRYKVGRYILEQARIVVVPRKGPLSRDLDDSSGSSDSDHDNAVHIGGHDDASDDDDSVDLDDDSDDDDDDDEPGTNFL